MECTFLNFAANSFGEAAEDPLEASASSTIAPMMPSAPAAIRIILDILLMPGDGGGDEI